MSDTDIAIVGMSGRFPGAENLEQFWSNLCSGTESLNQFQDYQPQEGGRAIQGTGLPFIKVNNLVKHVDLFDADFFSIAEREAKYIDPQHRIFLETAWAALENAGYFPGSIPSFTGLYAGVYANYYLLRHILPQGETRDPASELALTIGNEKDHLTTYTAYKLNLKGPVLTIQSTCSSSLASVHLACESLLTYAADMMLAGGVTISLPQIGGYFYQEGGLLSRDGQVRSFDAQASGTVYSNGVAVVVLKRLGDAIEGRDNIYAVIKGSAINNDGSNKIGYVAPSLDSQVQVIRQALKNGKVRVDEVTYVEGHGTGTPLGDRIELEALHRVFTGKEKKSCALGSVKSNIGHLGPVSGLSGLIKVALSLYYQKVPPSLNYAVPHDILADPSSPFYVNSHLLDWASLSKRYAGLSSFGLGGTNVHMVLAEPPRLQPSPGKKGSVYLCCLSAKTGNSLRKMIKQMHAYLTDHPDVDLRDLMYTLQVGRNHFPFRFIAIFSSIEDLRKQLLEAGENVPCYPCDGTDGISLFLFLGFKEAYCSEHTLQHAWDSPGFDAHFHRVVARLSSEKVTLERGTSSDSLHVTMGTRTLSSRRLFYFVIYYVLGLQWIQSGLCTRGFASGKNIALFSALALSEGAPLSEIVQWLLLSRDEIRNNLSAIRTQIARSLTKQVVVYCVENKKLVPVSAEILLETLVEQDFLGGMNLEEGGDDDVCLCTLDGCLSLFPDSAGECEDKYRSGLYDRTLAQLWTRGFSIDWQRSYDGSDCPSRIPLPTYAFDGKRCWLEEPSSPPLSPPVAVKGDWEDFSQIENEIISLWQKYLGIEEIGMGDNFFEKGGTSLIATSLITAVQHNYRVRVELKDLFEFPTVEGFIHCILDRLIVNSDVSE